MVYKEPVRNEHIEAFLAGKLEEIPADLLPLVEERCKNMKKPAKSEKASKADKAHEPNDNFA
jgi:hypothetical protein